MTLGSSRARAFIINLLSQASGEPNHQPPNQNMARGQGASGLSCLRLITLRNSAPAVYRATAVAPGAELGRAPRQSCGRHGRTVAKRSAIDPCGRLAALLPRSKTGGRLVPPSHRRRRTLNRHLAREFHWGPTCSGTPAAVVGVCVDRQDMTTYQAQPVKLTASRSRASEPFARFSQP